MDTIVLFLALLLITHLDRDFQRDQEDPLSGMPLASISAYPPDALAINYPPVDVYDVDTARSVARAMEDYLIDYKGFPDARVFHIATLEPVNPDAIGRPRRVELVFIVFYGRRHATKH